ncbi:hypothetical protein FHS86_002633 [Roseimarinus sediminis]|jgi:hypothetical protein
MLFQTLKELLFYQNIFINRFKIKYVARNQFVFSKNIYFHPIFYLIRGISAWGFF